TRSNVRIVKNKRCKLYYASTAGGRRKTGSEWLKIFWNVLFKKFAADAARKWYAPNEKKQ
ncbi:MAG: hypothetical protein M3015_05430, partial [Bacteroidota bacterium]|nr:hypothetical protein [Bacteroidota bacterium]